MCFGGSVLVGGWDGDISIPLIDWVAFFLFEQQNVLAFLISVSSYIHFIHQYVMVSAFNVYIRFYFSCYFFPLRRYVSGYQLENSTIPLHATEYQRPKYQPLDFNPAACASTLRVHPPLPSHFQTTTLPNY
jgi:hypothetical protein